MIKRILPLILLFGPSLSQKLGENDVEEGSGLGDDPCPPKLDIAFVLDTSGSIEQVYKENINWTIDLVDALPISKDAVRLTTIQYAGFPMVEFTLNEIDSSEDAIKRLKNLTFLSGVTRTGYALRKTENELSRPDRGARLDAKKCIVLLTDGLSIDDPLRVSERLRNEKKMVIYVVSVGNDGFLPEMERIAGSKENTFGPKDFKRLKETLLKDVEDSRICANGLKPEATTEDPLVRRAREQSSVKTTAVPKTISPSKTMVSTKKTTKKPVFKVTGSGRVIGSAVVTKPRRTAANQIVGTQRIRLEDKKNDQKKDEEKKIKKTTIQTTTTRRTTRRTTTRATTTTPTTTTTTTTKPPAKIRKIRRIIRRKTSARPTTLVSNDLKTTTIFTPITTPHRRRRIVKLIRRRKSTTAETVTSTTTHWTTTSATKKKIVKLPNVTTTTKKSITTATPKTASTRTEPTSNQVTKRFFPKLIDRGLENNDLGSDEETRNRPVDENGLVIPTTRRIFTRPTALTTTTVKTTTSPTKTIRTTKTTRKPTTTTQISTTTRFIPRHRALAARSVVTNEGSKCPIDVLFIVDSSGSVVSVYDRQKEFLFDIFSTIDVSQQAHRVALLQFAGQKLQKTEWTFDRFKQSAQLVSAFERVRHITGTTYIGAALRSAKKLLDSRRRNAETIVVLLSDGYSQDDPIETAKEIAKLPRLDLYAVSVAENNNNEMLLQMTGDPGKVFVEANVDDLREKLVQRFNCQK